MNTILLTYFLFISFVSLRQILRGIHFLNWLGKKGPFDQFSYDLSETPKYPLIVVCIPVLRERVGHITESMTHFDKIDYPHKRTRIVYVTTEKEFTTPFDPFCNSVQFISSKVSELKSNGENRFMHIHYPYVTGDKADQLNFAIAELSKNLTEREFLIAVYDIDSRPDLEIAKIIANQFLEANRKLSSFQQYSLYFNNFTDLPIFMKCSAVHQTLWTFVYEMPTAFRQYKLSQQVVTNKRLLYCFERRLVYCIGHGHFIKNDTLVEAGYFPTNLLTEDLLLGYQLSLLEIPTKPIFNFDLVNATNTFGSLIRQSGRWFGGETNIRHIYRRTAESGRTISLCNKWAYLVRLYEISCWLMGPLVYTVLLLSSTRQPYVLALGIFSGLVYSMVKYTVFMCYAPQLNTITRGKFDPSLSEKILIVLLSPLRCLTNCIGPMFFIVQSIFLRVRGKNYEFERTEK